MSKQRGEKQQGDEQRVLDQLADVVGCSPLAREPLSGEQSIELARVFKAMGDPVRLRLLSLIASHVGGEACVCDLTDVFELSGPTISHHLKVLRQAGLITGERRGTWIYYRVRLELLGQVSAVLVPAPDATATLPVVPAAVSSDDADDTTGHAGPAAVDEPDRAGGVVAKLSTLDRFLPLWILLAMAVGLTAGRLIPALGATLGAVAIDGVSLPIALGLLIMMYPVLAKVRYDRLDTVTGDRRLMVCSLVLNWLIGPAVMFALAWLLLPDLAEYRTGLIVVGLARCIAMVVIWNDLACGDRDAAAVLVALNSIFQVIAFGALGWFYLAVLPGWLGLPTTGLDVSPWSIVRSVLIFLGLPLVAGYLTRRLGEHARGRAWYESTFLPRLGPFALYGLLFTITVLFALQGDAITSQPLDVARIALPLLAYFAVMWAGSSAVGWTVGLVHDRTTTLAFTAAGNNFELAIAVAIATWGATSGQALAGVVGPLIEVPVLIALVYVSLALRRRLAPATAAAAET